MEVVFEMELTSQQPLAGILRRFGAILLDGLIPMLIFLPVAGFAGAFVYQGPPTETTLTIAIFIVMLTYLGLMCYTAFVFAMWAYGLTPGKHLLGIGVVRQDTGLPVGFWRMALREIIGRWVAAIVCYLGYIWALFDANKQGWHDKIAKTLVVQTR
jgi:uncharacterized RDD family membrane protein YckC